MQQITVDNERGQKNQIAVRVNAAEVSIRSVALCDWWWEFSGLVSWAATISFVTFFFGRNVVFPINGNSGWGGCFGNRQVLRTRTGFLFECREERQRFTLAKSNKSRPSFSGLKQRIVLVPHPPRFDTAALPVGLVLLDERVAGDEVAGYGSGFHRAIDSS